MTLDDILNTETGAGAAAERLGRRCADSRDRRDGADRLWRRADHPSPVGTLDTSPVSLTPPICRFTRCGRRCGCCSPSLFDHFHARLCALAAKSRRAEMVLIPLLDILQSVPILGFLTFTVVFFLNLFPGRCSAPSCLRICDLHQPGMEHDFQHVPVDPQRAEGSRRRRAQLSPPSVAALLAARRTVRNARPDLEHDDVDVRRLVFRGGSEAITVGNTTVTLPGVGSYVASASSIRICRPSAMRS